MMRSLWTAASGMRAQQSNVDTIAHNLSNVNTIGYKTEQASFKSLLYQNLQSTSTNNAGEDKPVPAQVGLGTRVAAVTSQFSQGNLLASTNPLNVAMDGDGFFQVRNIDGEVLYTRDGSFAASPLPGDQGNLLCTGDGYPVLDANGNTIIFPSDKLSTNVRIDEWGRMGFEGEDGNTDYLRDAAGEPIQFGIVQFNNPAGLEKVGNNNYRMTVASGNPVAERGNDNLMTSKVHQFYTEGSNVDVAEEMVNLIVAQRAYEMNSKAIQTTDDMMQQANNLR
ncbi:MAG: flagellar hook-basal body protein [Lachnospiraceae bacterium]|nr:flagellar hook-basal body protein [Lachnospiraceae bacterium]